MKLLLDTHVALWATADPRRLPSSITDRLMAPSAQVLVSVVSLWEIAIKAALRRTQTIISASAALALFEEAGFAILSLQPEHTIAVSDLPPIHRDPFDRMLIAQALTEPARLVSHDALLGRYSDTVILF